MNDLPWLLKYQNLPGAVRESTESFWTSEGILALTSQATADVILWNCLSNLAIYFPSFCFNGPSLDSPHGSYISNCPCSLGEQQRFTSLLTTLYPHALRGYAFLK